jgi:serine-type D-Ala-D-Ala carboxypeptidase (penicillin-binding protein 5/6)
MLRLFLSLAVSAALAASGSAAPKKTTKKSPSKPAAEKKEEPKKELAPGELPIFARSAIVLDQATGEVLYEKNADAMEYPASSTKVLTALLVIEAGDLDKLVTVEKSDTEVEPSALYIKPGEQYPRRHLLYALLLKSGNDTARALARDNAGSVESFAEKMTARAAELGAESSHFKNPHGLHDPHHYTTARDLAKIARVAMQNPLFREIVATPEIWMRKSGDWIWLKNHNRLLSKMEECIGVKTGYTRAAQQVLVSAAAKEGKEALSVVLHTNKPGIWDDSQLLLKHGLAKLLNPPTTPPAAPTAPTPATTEPAATPANAGDGHAIAGSAFPPIRAGKAAADDEPEGFAAAFRRWRDGERRLDRSVRGFSSPLASCLHIADDAPLTRRPFHYGSLHYRLRLRRSRHGSLLRGSGSSRDLRR